MLVFSCKNNAILVTHITMMQAKPRFRPRSGSRLPKVQRPRPATRQLITKKCYFGYPYYNNAGQTQVEAKPTLRSGCRLPKVQRPSPATRQLILRMRPNNGKCRVPESSTRVPTDGVKNTVGINEITHEKKL